ncbi:Lectin C-type domain family protein [Acanthocheilonema viteae]
MNSYSTIIFMACFTAALCATCDEGWRFSPHSRKCYKYFPKAMTWTEAEFHCLMQRSHLLSIHNLRENKFAKEIARDGSEVWLGSAKFGKSTKFEWSDKTLFNFNRWKNGQKPVTKSIKPCTKMNVTNGEWFQSCCRVVAAYICQKDPQSPKPHVNKEQNTYDTTGKNFALNQKWRFLLRK